MFRIRVLLLVLLAGWASAQSNYLNVLLSSQITTLEPYSDTDTDSSAVRYSIYNGLLTMTQAGIPAPDLATSWAISEDGLEYEFYLREGVVFHDGTPFNAEAVKASFDYLLRADNNTSAAATLKQFVESVEVTSEFSVKFTLNTPFGPFLNNMAHQSTHIASPTAIEKYGPALAENPVGTGPFRFVEWVRGDHLRLETFSDYYGELPGVDGILYRIVPEVATRIALLESGEADVILRVSPDEAERLSTAPGIVLDTTFTSRVMYIALNMNRPPLDDVRVRQAINHAVNVRGIIDALFGPDTPQMDSPLAPNVDGYSPAKTYEYNPDLARSLFAEAGVDPQSVTLSLWAPNGRYVHDATVAQAVAQQLEQFGIDIDLRIFGDFAEYLEVANGPNRGDMNMFGWTPSTLEGYQGMYQNLHGDRANLFANSAGYNNPVFNDALTATLRITDEGEKQAAFAAIQELVMEDAPFLFLYVQPVITAMSDHVSGVYLLPSEQLILRSASKR